MRTKAIIFNLLAVLVLTLLFIGGLCAIEWIQPSNKEDKIPIPEKHNWMVQLDAANFWKNEVYTVLFEAKDVAFLQELRSFVEEKLANDSEKKYPLSLSLNSNVVLIQFDYAQEKFLATYFDVTDPSLFLTNIKHYLTNKQIVTTIGNKAVILTNLTSNKLNHRNNKALNYLLKSTKKNIQFNQKRSIAFSVNTTNTHGQFSIYTTTHSINFSGEMTINKPIKQSEYRLKHEGLSLQSTIIPAELTNYITLFNKKNDAKLPAITACEIDYLGLELADEKAGIPAVMGYSPIPKMNALLTFEQPISITQFTALFPPSVRLNEKTLNFGALVYSVVQLDATTLFIGLDSNTIQKKKREAVCSINGDLSRITQVYGNEFIAGFIKNIPPVKAATTFFNTITASSLNVLPTTKKNVYKVTGSIRFNANNHAINELAKFGFSLLK